MWVILIGADDLKPQLVNLNTVSRVTEATNSLRLGFLDGSIKGFRINEGNDRNNTIEDMRRLIVEAMKQ